MEGKLESLKQLAQSVQELEARRAGNSHDAEYLRLYAARRALSNFCWDLFSAHCYQHYVASAKPASAPELSQGGFLIGTLPREIAADLLKQFRLCPPYDPPVCGHEFTPGHFFGPGVSESTAAQVRRMFITRRMTDGMAGALRAAFSTIAERLEVVMGHFWKIAHVRLYELLPDENNNAGSWHSDGWPIGLKKLYIYLEGANTELGTTQLRVAEGVRTVEGPPGVWALFENSRVIHRAFPSRHRIRPAIEVNILPAMQTDTTPVHTGISGNYPWYPVDFGEMDHPAIPDDFRSGALEYRCIMRTLGLAGAIRFQDTSLGVDPFHTPEGWSAAAAGKAGHSQDRAQVRADFETLERQIAAMQTSSSWRLTAPLRWLGRKLRAKR